MPEQIIRTLAEGEKLLGQGQPVDEVAPSETSLNSPHHPLTELLRMNELTDLTNQP